MPKRIMVQCRTNVNRDAVRRESINGVEHIVVSSATLPDNIVMNGGLYPADEIEKSFMTLDMTLAPIEHPVDAQGNYISAADPHAIHNFHAGAYNTNIRREDGRVFVDKYINVQEALKTERGKRLLDRIDELENNDDPRPIHTSVGVFLFPEELEEVQTNDDGQEFGWIAREMVFDHDAILLDSVGAAQPHQGVGVAVNNQGDEFEVQTFELNQSLSELHESVGEALERSAVEVDWIEELFTDRVIFRSKDQLFEVPYVVDDEGIVTIVGIPLPVERNVTFTPKTNSEGDAMRELMLNALAAAGITVNADISDADLLAKYNELQTTQTDSNGEGAGDDKGIAEVVANALQPLTEKIGNLEAKLNAADTAKKESLIQTVVNSGKHPGLEADDLKDLGVEVLKKMAANCQTGYGLTTIVNGDQGGINDDHKAPTDMPS